MSGSGRGRIGFGIGSKHLRHEHSLQSRARGPLRHVMVEGYNMTGPLVGLVVVAPQVGMAIDKGSSEWSQPPVLINLLVDSYTLTSPSPNILTS